jgi:hypothetical protein
MCNSLINGAVINQIFYSRLYARNEIFAIGSSLNKYAPVYQNTQEFLVSKQKKHAVENSIRMLFGIYSPR